LLIVLPFSFPEPGAGAVTLVENGSDKENGETIKIRSVYRCSSSLQTPEKAGAGKTAPL